MDARIAWSLIRYTEAGKTTLASGQADSYDRVPALFTLDKHPMYLLADDSGLSVFRVEGSEVSAVLTVPDSVMPSSVTVCSNGRQYAFLAAVNGSPHCTVFICDGSGILRQKELSKPVTTFAITDDYVVCGLALRTQMHFPVNPFPSAAGIRQQPILQRPCGGWPEAAIVVCMLTVTSRPTSSIRIHSRPIPLP